MAKKFTFQLEAVLRYREMLEEDRKKDLAFATTEVRSALDALNQVLDEQEQTREQARMNATGTIDPSFLGQYNDYFLGIKIRIEKLKKILGEKRELRKQKLANFVQARKDRRALEILKENRYEEYRKEVEQENEKIINDIVMSRLGAETNASRAQGEGK